MSDQNSDEKFPNSQLREVNCAIRFPAFIKISDRIKDFQSKIRNNMPFFETQNRPALSQQGYYIEETWWLFKSEDQNLILKVKNNVVILSTNNYTTFDKFYEDLKSNMGAFLEMYRDEINQFSRIGLRYINRYDFMHENSNIEELMKYFKLLYLNLDEIDEVNNFNVFFNKKIHEFNINITNIYNKNPKGKYSFLYDYDSYHLGNSNLNNYLEIIEKLHKNIKETFEKNITTDFKVEVLRLNNQYE